MVPEPDLYPPFVVSEFSVDELLERGVAAVEAERFVDAMRWFTRAADRGNARAMYQISKLYAGGRGVARNEAAAVLWIRMAAERGDSDAMVGLGSNLEYGWSGVPQDRAEALRWYRKAAALGNASAMLSIAIFYDAGYEIPKDDVAAMAWCRKAADLGDKIAMHSVGMRYELGLGVPQDHAEARVWLEKAAAAGFTTASDWLLEHPRVENLAIEARSAPASSIMIH
jgi:uncharacterized protein